MVNFEFNKYCNLKYETLNLDLIINKLVEENEMFSWYDLNSAYIEDILATKNKIINMCDVFLIIGAGGSINCSKAIIESFKSNFKQNKPEIVYLGNNLSSDYLLEVFNYIKDKQVCVNVVSKSGSTLEVNLTTDIIIYLLNKKYSKEELKNRVIVTTENSNNFLTQLANEYGFKRYIIEKNIGGRFSMFTPSSLLAIAVAGIDINQLIEGARRAKKDKKLYYQYTLYRHNMYLNNLVVEAFNIYDPKLGEYLEWVKQLFAESQGKNGKGILPITNINTGDLHSMGQYLQDGLNIIFETNIYNHSLKDAKVVKYNRTIDDINYIAMLGVTKAHYDNNKNSIIIEMDKIDEFNLGYLSFFFMISATLGSCLLRVNPFDQNGVNAYKKNILDCLEK